MSKTNRAAQIINALQYVNDPAPRCARSRAENHHAVGPQGHARENSSWAMPLMGVEFSIGVSGKRIRPELSELGAARVKGCMTKRQAIEEGLAEHRLAAAVEAASADVAYWTASVASPCCRDCGWLQWAREQLHEAQARQASLSEIDATGV